MDKQEDLMSLEMRKQLLITQGAMYRSGILASKEKVVHGLRADSLAQGVIKQLGLAAYAAWRGRSGFATSNLSTLVPLLAGGVSSLWRKSSTLKKPVLRGAVIAGVLASAATLFFRWKNKSASASSWEDE